MAKPEAKRIISVLLALCLSCLALWWLLRGDTGRMIMAALREANPWYLGLAAFFAVVIQLVRAWRFSILSSGDTALPSSIMIGIATRLILLNFLLPFKLGELGFPVMMKQAFGTPIAQSAGILLLSRLLDLGVVTAILLLTAAFLVSPLITGWSVEMFVLGGLVMLILPVSIIDWLPRLRGLTVGFPVTGRLAEQLSFGARMVHPARRRMLVFALTCSIWCLHSLIAYVTALSIQADLALLPLAMASAASNLAFALPISGFAGLGPPQAAWASVLNLLGIDWASAVTTALLCHGLLLTTISIWGALIYLRLALRASSKADEQRG